MGNGYETENITKMLNVDPTETWKEGDSIRNTGRKRTYTAWIYSTDAIETLDINIQVKKIEDLFSDKTVELCVLKERYDLEFSLDFIIIIEKEEVPAIYFNESFIQFAAKIGARFDFDTYVN